MTLRKPLKQYVWLWFFWLAVFYGLWLWLVLGLGLWPTARDHWPIALAMALGSYVAGSTPLGGGSVGFPVLVLLFDMPATLGRDFSFAVQSIGMTSASIFIFARRQALAIAVLKGAVCGTLIGAPLGILFIAPLLSELWIKIIFAVVWASFGLLHLYRLNEIANHSGMTEFNERWDLRLGLLIGLVSSSTIVAVTGVGVDMLLYAALVLLCRADLKIAIPTSVVIMAFTSVYGMLIKYFASGVQEGVFENWLAAAPIVVLGAPLGVFIVSLIGRKPTLFFVALLCVAQFVWTCINEFSSLGIWGLSLAVLAVLCLLFLFEKLRIWGGILAAKVRSSRHLSSLGIREVEPHVRSTDD